LPLKNLLSAIVIILVPCFVQAQFTILAETDVFPEPENALAKMIQLKSGFTMYLQIIPNDGIEISLFDAGHHSLAVKKFQPEYGELKKFDVEGIFEMNGNVSIFISEKAGSGGILYRLTIDGSDGRLVETKLIAKENKRAAESTVPQAQSKDFKQKTAMADVPAIPLSGSNSYASLFNVRHNTSNTQYAIATYNNSAPLNGIDISVYDTTHQVFRQLYLKSPDPIKNRLEFIDMVLAENMAVYVIAYSGAVNSDKLQALFGQSVLGDTMLSVHPLPVNADRAYTEGILRYNETNQKLYFLAAYKKEKKLLACRVLYGELTRPQVRLIQAANQIYRP
jgi:hypothetical protein